MSWPRLALACFLLANAARAQQPSNPGPSPAQAPAAAPHGAVVASSDHIPQSDGGNSAVSTAAVKATDAERESITFTRYALDIHLIPRDHRISVHARIGLRNDGPEPLTVVPLQLSSSLTWSSVRVADKPAQVDIGAVKSDADHTGKLNEAVVHLSAPLPPHGELALDAFYSGAIPQDATRLTEIGTPPDLAANADWDGIAPDFTGLRGFGNVVWYPVASVPVALGDGDKLFSEIGLTKLRQISATMSLSITDEVYLGGSSAALPTVAILDGIQVPLTTVAKSTSSDLPTILTCSLPPMPLGFSTPGLFLAVRTDASGNDLRFFARPENLAATQSYMTASTMVASLIRQWLGAHAKSDLTLLDLPSAQDAPFEDRQTLYTGLRNTGPDHLVGTMSHALAHAYFLSRRPWLNEGVAEFMASLRTEQVSGREAALSQLDSLRPALALAEPANASANADAGQPLVRAHDAIYYRTKANYVLWMLRAIAGDGSLAAALHSYDAARDTTDDYFERLLEQTSGKKLDWFFEDWVYRDRGLPDLSIVSVFPAPASGADSFLVAVTVSNSGDAAAEVPVTVTSAETTATERVLVPARSTAVRRILIQGRPDEVQVNDGTVPEVEASVHRTTLKHTP